MKLVAQDPHKLDGNSVRVRQAVRGQRCATVALEQARPTPTNAHTASWAGPESRSLVLRACDSHAQVPERVDVTQVLHAGRAERRLAQTQGGVPP